MTQLKLVLKINTTCKLVTMRLLALDLGTNASKAKTCKENS